MNATELFLSDGRPAGIFYCATCRVVKRAKEEADACCAVRLCGCGEKLQQFYTLCNSCSQRKRDEAMELKMLQAQKLEAWDGPVFYEGYSSHNEGYFEDMGELLDFIANLPDDDEELANDPKPEFVFVCTREPFPFSDVGEIIERATCDRVDSEYVPEFKGKAELQQALDAFAEVNKDVVYWETDYKRAVRVPKLEVSK